MKSWQMFRRRSDLPDAAVQIAARARLSVAIGVKFYTRGPAPARYRAISMFILINATAHALCPTHVQLIRISTQLAKIYVPFTPALTACVLSRCRQKIPAIAVKLKSLLLFRLWYIL